jgi:hypothetical protein
MSFELPVHCEHCLAERLLDVWVIVSSVDRQDVLDRVRSGDYPSFVCERCRQVSALDTPMLIHRPDQGGLAGLIYSPAYVASPEDTSTAAEGLVTILIANLGLSAPGVPVRILPVPRLGLPAVLSRDVRRDMRTPPEQLDLPAEVAGPYYEMISHLRGSGR